MKPVNIVIVNDFAYINGGAGKIAISSAQALAEQGHRVYLFSAVGPVMPELEASMVKVISLDQHEIANDSNQLRAAAQGIWNRKAYAAMCQLLDSLDPKDTIIHFHVWTKSLSSSVSRAVSDKRFPAVLTMHDYFLACPNGGFFNYQQSNVCRLSPLSLQCVCRHCDKTGYSHKLWRLVRQTVQRSVGKLPDSLNHFIAISKLSEEIIRPHLPEHARIHRVTNPITIAKQSPAAPARNENFLFLGRLDPEKGPVLFAKAAHKAGVPVVFVGEGSCREQIKSVNPEAVLTGWLDPKEVADKLKSARALVFPSLWYETQGLTVLEAAALGVPAIVPDSSAAVEMIEDGITGLVFRSGSVDDLSRKISILTDNETVARMGRAAYDRYWENPSTMDRHIAQLESVYREMLRSPTGVEQSCVELEI